MKMEKVISFDQAANVTGWSYWENEKPIEWGIITPTPKTLKDGQRLNNLYEKYESLIKKYNPTFIIYEPPIGDDDNGKGYKTLYVLSQIAGLIEMLCAKYKIRLYEMTAARWQFNCGIHRRERSLRKQGARMFVQKEYNIAPEHISQDEVDSLCIAYSFFKQRERDRVKESAF